MDINAIGKKVDLSGAHWIGDIPDNEGLKLLVRSSRYKPYRVAVLGKARRSQAKMKTDEGFFDYASVDSGGSMADHLLLGWEGVTDAGKPVKFSVETARAILTADDDHGVGEGFRNAVVWAAEKVAEQLAATTEEAAGN